MSLASKRTIFTIFSSQPQRPVSLYVTKFLPEIFFTRVSLIHRKSEHIDPMWTIMVGIEPSKWSILWRGRVDIAKNRLNAPPPFLHRRSMVRSGQIFLYQYHIENQKTKRVEFFFFIFKAIASVKLANKKFDINMDLFNISFIRCKITC